MGAGGQGCWRTRAEEDGEAASQRCGQIQLPEFKADAPEAKEERAASCLCYSHPSTSHGKQSRAEAKGSQLQVVNLK